MAVCLSTLTLLASPTDAQVLPSEDHVVELGVMLWKPSPAWTVSLPLFLAGLDGVDFAFGAVDKPFPEFAAVIGRRHKLRVSHVSITYDADATIESTFRFPDGTSGHDSAPASTHINWDLWKFGYEWDFVSRKRGFVGLLTDVAYNKLDSWIGSPFLPYPAGGPSIDTRAATLGVIARVHVVPMVAVTGEFTGLRVSRHEFEAGHFDSTFYGTVSFGRHVGVQGGYRSLAIDQRFGEDRYELKMKGPYAGAVVRF